MPIGVKVVQRRTRGQTYQREVCKEQADELIYEFYMEQYFTCDCMVCNPNLLEVDEGVDGREECTVQPSSSL